MPATRKLAGASTGGNFNAGLEQHEELLNSKTGADFYDTKICFVITVYLEDQAAIVDSFVSSNMIISWEESLTPIKALKVLHAVNMHAYPDPDLFFVRLS